MKQRIIEVISEDKRYRTSPYPAVVMEHGSLNNMYVNGLEYRPGDPEREDWLTQDEIKGKEVTPKKRAEMFPQDSVLTADHLISIQHRMKLNLTLKSEKLAGKVPGDYVFPRDYAIYVFLLTLPNVAKAKDLYLRGKHHFYIKDEEKEAVQRISKRKLVFEANRYLHEDLSLERMRELAALISFKTNQIKFGDVDKLSSSVIEDRLFSIAETEPQFILDCNPEKNEGVAEELFVVKAIQNNIVTRKGLSYYDGTVYIGDDMKDIIKYIQKESDVVPRWKTKMDNK